MPFNAPKVPEDIWSEIALFSGLKEVLALEATCKFLHNVVSNKALWLKQLRALDQDHAPDLPRHISVDELDWLQVRTLVVRAYRRRLNCTGPAPLQPTREITVRIGSAKLNKALGEPHGFWTAMELLPGGRLLVLWIDDYLLCWDVPNRNCIWMYPDPASSDKHDLRVRGFCYEMQADNVVHIVTKTESLNVGSSFEIFRISAETKEPNLLYKYPEQYPHVSLETRCMKLHGGISAICTRYNLFVTFWKERRTVEIESIFKAIDMVGGYLICMISEPGVESVVAILLSSIRKALPNDSTASALVLEDLPYTKCPLPFQRDWVDFSAEISTCDFHWKSEAGRKSKGITITVVRYLKSRTHGDFFSVVDSFLLETAPGTASMSRSRFLLQNDSLPRLTHVGDPQFIVLDPQLGNYRCRPVKRLSQAGSAVAEYIGLRNPGTPDTSRFLWMLATISCGKEVVLRKLGLPLVKSVGMEFYSGAVYFLTMDAKSVVIQYFD